MSHPLQPEQTPAPPNAPPPTGSLCPGVAESSLSGPGTGWSPIRVVQLCALAFEWTAGSPPDILKQPAARPSWLAGKGGHQPAGCRLWGQEAQHAQDRRGHEAGDALPCAGGWWPDALTGLKEVRLLPSMRLPGAPVGVSSQLPNFLFSQENLAAEALKSSLKCLPGVPDVLGSLQHLSA